MHNGYIYSLCNKQHYKWRGMTNLMLNPRPLWWPFTTTNALNVMLIHFALLKAPRFWDIYSQESIGHWRWPTHVDLLKFKPNVIMDVYCFNFAPNMFFINNFHFINCHAIRTKNFLIYRSQNNDDNPSSVDSRYLISSKTMLLKYILLKPCMDLVCHLMILRASSIWTYVVIKMGWSGGFWSMCDFQQRS